MKLFVLLLDLFVFIFLFLLPKFFNSHLFTKMENENFILDFCEAEHLAD